MLDRASWERHTKQLHNLGQSGRFEHDCGEGRVLKVSHNDDGYTAWCFRCSEAGFIAHPAPSLSERLARLEARRSAEVVASSSVELPLPVNADPHAGGWPLAARVWLYKAGLSNDDIMRLGAYYHEPTGRVILPVYDGGKLVYWQGRNPSWKRGDWSQKYINPPVNKSHLCAKYGAGPAIVLTEDILSAFRAARVTESWSLMGTALASGVLADLLKQDRPVVVMLDPDSGGQSATDKIIHKLNLLGVACYAASPHRDPKYLTREETRSCILTSRPARGPLPPPSSLL